MRRRGSPRTLPERGRALVRRATRLATLSFRTRRELLLASARPILHTAVAAAGAWLAARELLGHEQPFFAPIAAVITLGLSAGQRGRRAVELALGVALGIFVADVLILAIGTGTAQVALVVALAMTASLLLGGGPMLASQAAVSAALVATLEPPAEGFSFDRLLDALTGGATALLVAALVFPLDPLTLVRRAAAPVLSELALTLEGAATALEARDADRAEQVLLRARAMDADVAGLREAVGAARESARLSLRGRRRVGGAVGRYGEAARQLDFAVRNARVIARGAVRTIQLGDATPPALHAAVRELARAVRSTGDALDESEDAASEARAAVLSAATQANAVLEQTGNMSALHMVAQVRATSVDLLRALGLERREAETSVRGPLG